jgi:hypothetical protein
MAGQYVRPETVTNQEELFEVVKALTLDHVYASKTINIPYLGCLAAQDMRSLESTIRDLSAQQFELRGLTLHCASGILNKETNKRSKVLSIVFNRHDLALGMYLNIILEELSSTEYSWSIDDSEVEAILTLLSRYFKIKLSRKDPNSLIWYSKI